MKILKKIIMRGILLLVVVVTYVRFSMGAFNIWDIYYCN